MSCVMGVARVIYSHCLPKMEGTDEADEEKNCHTLTWLNLDRENTVTTPVELDSGLC